MVHYGKHIIDPQTGLCEICDRGAIHDLRRGKRSGKLFLYSNQDGRFTYRPSDTDQHDFDEPTTRSTRKPTNNAPGRSRPTGYDDPPMDSRRPPHRDHTPPDESTRRNVRSRIFYEVDNEGQMYPRDDAPPNEPRRRYLTQNPQTRNHDHRRAKTPSPPRTETWNTRSRRGNNSDSEVNERVPRTRAPNNYRTEQTALVYYLEADPRPSGRSQVLHNDDRMPATNRRPHQLEPIGRKTYREPEPVVERKVYRKLAATPTQPPRDLYTTNGDHLRLTKKVETIYPSPRAHDTTAPTNSTYDRSSRPKKYATVYEIQADSRY